MSGFVIGVGAGIAASGNDIGSLWLWFVLIGVAAAACAAIVWLEMRQ